MIILAAGKGTRMKSEYPKVLQEIGKKPMLSHLLDLSPSLGSKKTIVIYGYKGDQLKARVDVLGYKDIQWVKQTEQLGTGHAVQQAIPFIKDNIIYLILVGDIPLIKHQTLSALGELAVKNKIAVLTAKINNPFGYGRIIRDNDNKITGIIEEKDTTDKQKNIKEVNTGIFAVNGCLLKNLLSKINNSNSQKEYYLTDIVKIASQKGIVIGSHTTDNQFEVMGCNDKIQLAELERYYQKELSNSLLLQGTTLADPDRVNIRGQLNVGYDCFIDINTIFEGKVLLGNNSQIEANCIIKNSIIGDNVIIKANSYIENATIKNNIEIGPFARVRPNTLIENNCKVGNFVELKNASLDRGTKVSHLSYIGDTEIGKYVNVGAGTITCNYDGTNKYKTIIKDNAFIGSNTSLIAPVTINSNATVAAGSAINKDIENNNLGIARAKQINLDWKKRKK